MVYRKFKFYIRLTNIVFNFEDDKNFSTDLEVALNLVIQKCKKIITKKYEVIIAREHERLDLLKKCIGE